MDDGREWRNGACHCGAVRFRVRLTVGLGTARRCDCSLCRMRGAVAVTAGAGDLEILEGEEVLTLYRFNTGVAQHFFCSRCGIYTHHRRRSNPDQLGINAACLEGVSPFDFREVPVNNGRSHPSDGGSGPDVVGTLRFEPAF
ncbi:GFA family protein [Aureimonas leprariae]|uniref:GFA family protein n=1 Tax=Plantimonas leprariae TaxID=2615207 RepID=A0A7V7PNP9_9HYPH|nr:GFA family protein [Aureimonas leprariae]KAB0679343.1 GFA family protein [Aureimonas leprariae]